jgi:beta-lactam-binding protein with PASTA domain
VAKDNGYGRAIATGDLNGDSRPDLVPPRSRSVSVLLSKPGLCTVQDVREVAIAAAKRTIPRANCRVGKIRRAYSKNVRRGRVRWQTLRPGTVLPGGGKVNLVVSRGRRPS